MRLKRCVLPILFLAFWGAADNGFSQVSPSATEGRLPLTVGGGFSNFNADWGNGRVSGGGLWIDYYPGIVPRRLKGLGVEIDAHDLSFGRSPTIPKNFRQDTAGAGVIYSWHHFPKARPYAKGLMGIGSFDFGPNGTSYTHDTRTYYSVGGGLDYHLWNHVWVRGDYEYQTWQVMFGRHSPTPNGFTIGAIYDFRHWYSDK